MTVRRRQNLQTLETRARWLTLDPLQHTTKHLEGP